VYPLGEKEVVVGFEAVIAGRLVGVQIQSRGKLKDCGLDCCPGSVLEGNCGNGREWGCCGSSSLDMQCTNGEDGRRLAVFPLSNLMGTIVHCCNDLVSAEDKYRRSQFLLGPVLAAPRIERTVEGGT